MATNYGTRSSVNTGFRTLDDGGFGTTRQRFNDALLEAQQQTNNLQHFSRQLGTSADNEHLRRDINNLMHTTSEQLETAKSSLRELVEIVRETRDRSQLETVRSLTQSVKEATAKFRRVGDETQEWLRLHADLLYCNQIMEEIGQMMVEQGETIDITETEVERGYAQVQQANEQLSKAVTYKSSSCNLL